ncbi:MAG: hypothetical protein MUP85_17695 [Candidatus Lokiarchaeota archaeon]|nr:hypothetical protein [Candidatus Lokiarchaeota archaeon]
MNSDIESWVTIGLISGFIGLSFYFLAVFPLLPYEIAHLTAFFIGLIILLFCVRIVKPKVFYLAVLFVPIFLYTVNKSKLLLE